MFIANASEGLDAEIFCNNLDDDCNPETSDNPDIDNDGVNFCEDFCPGSFLDNIEVDETHYAKND